MQALDLLVSSHSSREDFTTNDLNLIRDTFKLNMVIQSPAERQEMVTFIKKMHLRIRNALEKVLFFRVIFKKTNFFYDLVNVK